MPKNSHKGDLILFYITRPHQLINNIFIIDSIPKYENKIYYADIKLICKLDRPIHLNDLRKSQFLKDMKFISKNMQGSSCENESWHHLYNLILKKNPSLKKKLKKYSPEKLRLI